MLGKGSNHELYPHPILGLHIFTLQVDLVFYLDIWKSLNVRDTSLGLICCPRDNLPSTQSQRAGSGDLQPFPAEQVKSTL